MKSVNEMTELEIKNMMAELAKVKERDAKAKARAKEYRDRNPEKTKEWSERARVRNQILVQKAKAAGLTVSEKEVDEYLASK